MEIFMKETGKMIKHLDMELIFIQMEQNTKASGRTIINMGKVFKLGLTAVNMTGITLRGRKVDKENTHGEMAVIISAHGKIIR
jgi:hypothetical protein